MSKFVAPKLKLWRKNLRFGRSLHLLESGGTISEDMLMSLHWINWHIENLLRVVLHWKSSRSKAAFPELSPELRVAAHYFVYHFIDRLIWWSAVYTSESHHTKAHRTILIFTLFMKETYSALTGECASDIASLSVSRKSYSGILPSCTDVELPSWTLVRSVELFFYVVITKNSLRPVC